MSPKAAIARLCMAYAPHLRAPASVDPAKVLWALAGCESDFGAAALPRHEAAYCNIGRGRYDVTALTRQWGCAAHCSYGPWQMMFGHLVDFHPLHDALTPAFFIVRPPTTAGDLEYTVMAEHSIRCAVAMLNAVILGRQGATTLAEVAKAWNHGNWRDQFDDSAYTDRAARFYATPFPDGATAPPASQTEVHNAPAPAPPVP